LQSFVSVYVRLNHRFTGVRSITWRCIERNATVRNLELYTYTHVSDDKLSTNSAAIKTLSTSICYPL